VEVFGTLRVKYNPRIIPPGSLYIVGFSLLGTAKITKLIWKSALKTLPVKLIIVNFPVLYFLFIFSKYAGVLREEGFLSNVKVVIINIGGKVVEISRVFLLS